MRKVFCGWLVAVATLVGWGGPATAADLTSQMQELIRAAKAEGQVEVLLSGQVPFPEGDVAYHHRHTPPPRGDGTQKFCPPMSASGSAEETSGAAA